MICAARAAAAARAGGLDGVDDLLRGHLGQDLGQGLVSVKGDVFVDALRVDDAAVAQRDALLLFIEVDLVQGLGRALLLDGLAAEQVADDAALEQVLVDDLVDVFGLDVGVERALRVYDDDGAHLAKAEAPRAHDLDFLLQAGILDLLLKETDQFRGAGGCAARAAANQNLRTKQVHVVKPPTIILYPAKAGLFFTFPQPPPRRWCTR